MVWGVAVVGGGGDDVLAGVFDGEGGVKVSGVSCSKYSLLLSEGDLDLLEVSRLFLLLSLLLSDEIHFSYRTLLLLPIIFDRLIEFDEDEEDDDELLLLDRFL